MDTIKEGFRILDVYTGSRIQIFPSRIQVQKDPGSGSASKNLSKFNPKNCFKLLEKLSGMFIPYPDFFPIPDPDSGSRNKKVPDPDPHRRKNLTTNLFPPLF
jgi:hypothetical protein